MSLVSSIGGIIEEAANRLNEVSADKAEQYLSWINICTRDVALSFPNAPFLYASADRTLSAGTRHYTNLPTDFEKIITISDPANSNKLKYLTEEEFDLVVTSASDSGFPTIYTLHGAIGTASAQLEFYPIPATGLTLNYQYRKLPQLISATSVSPQLPLKYYDLYVDYIVMNGMRRREDYAQADAVENKYEILKQKMIDDFKRVTEEPWRIKSVREFTAINQNSMDKVDNMFWGE